MLTDKRKLNQNTSINVGPCFCKKNVASHERKQAGGSECILKPGPSTGNNHHFWTSFTMGQPNLTTVHGLG
jgi:hypothetical protein